MRTLSKIWVAFAVLGAGSALPEGSGPLADAGLNATGSPPVCGSLGGLSAPVDCVPAGPPPTWPSMARQPLSFADAVTLEACTPVPRCLVEQVRRREPLLAKSGLLVLTARGVEIHGPAADLAVASFLDVRRASWVSHRWFEPRDRAIAAFVSPTSPIVGLCTSSATWSTAPGFQSEGPCGVFDLSSRDLLFSLPQGDLQGAVTGVRGAVVDLQVYFRDLPAWCRKGPVTPDTKNGRAYRSGPLYALKATVEFSPRAARVRRPPAVFTFSDMKGEEPDGRCLALPPQDE